LRKKIGVDLEMPFEKKKDIEVCYATEEDLGIFG
jgi:hypothetical protein